MSPAMQPCPECYGTRYVEYDADGREGPCTACAYTPIGSLRSARSDNPCPTAPDTQNACTSKTVASGGKPENGCAGDP